MQSGARGNIPKTRLGQRQERTNKNVGERQSPKGFVGGQEWVARMLRIPPMPRIKTPYRERAYVLHMSVESDAYYRDVLCVVVEKEKMKGSGSRGGGSCGV